MNKTIIHNLQLETISPVTVGNGSSLSPLADYVIEENELFYIDQQTFESYLEEDRQLLEKYTNGVYNVSGKSKDRFLKNFIQYDLEVELDVICKYSVPVYYNKDLNPIELHTIEKSVDRPYIPGSSLKGAIKWAILYNYIKDNNKINSLVNIINQQAFERKQDRDKEKDIDKFFQTIENELFGDIKNGMIKKMPFSLLKISDSQPAKNHAGVFEFVREHMRKGTKVISQLREALLNENLAFKVAVTHEFDNENLGFLNHEKPYELFKVINETVKNIILFEIDTIENSSIGSETDYELSDNLIRFYLELLERIKINQDKIAFLPIGFAKNYYLNSIGLLIKQKDNNAFKSLRKIYHMGKQGQLFFPVTRYVCFAESYMPAGWIKISETGYVEKESEAGGQRLTDTAISSKKSKAPSAKLEQERYSQENIQNETTVTARVLTVERPQSLIEIIIDEEPVLVRMTGTKKAQKEGRFEEDCIVNVKLTVKEGKITQTQFVSF